MNLSTATQESLLALLCYDPTDGAVAASLVEAKHFDPVYKEIAALAIDYRQRHKQAPGEHTLDLFDTARERDPDRAELFERLFGSVQGTAKNINGAYVLGKARAFIRHQRLKRALAESIRGIEKSDEEGLTEAESVLTKALKESEATFEVGTRFLVDPARSVEFLDRWEDSLPTGIPILDYYGLGPVPGRLHLYIGPAKSGKSWWLTNLATRAHQHAKRALIVTMEMGESEYCQRLTQSFFGMSKRAMDTITYRKFRKTENQEDWGTDYERVKLYDTQHLSDPDVRAKLFKKMEQFRSGERLIVKSFPTGTLSTTQLDGYLDLLEHHERFIPDLLIVDYADIMRLPSKGDRWEGLLDVAINLRRIAQERHIAVATASQTKISGARAGRVDTQHVSGAWDKIATADTILTYSQTDEERKEGLARLFVAAARGDVDRFEILLSQQYAIGQYVLSSIPLGSAYYKQGETEE